MRSQVATTATRACCRLPFLIAAVHGGNRRACPHFVKAGLQRRLLSIGAAMNAAPDHREGSARRRPHRVPIQFHLAGKCAQVGASFIPSLDKYDFDLADKYVAFGHNTTCSSQGHNLVWHSQVPQWVFHDDKGNLLYPRRAACAHARPYSHRRRPVQREESIAGTS